MPAVCTLIVALFLLGAPALVAGQNYTCPMHPEVKADQAGTCPICGMDLIPATSTGPRAVDLPAVGLDCDAASVCRPRPADLCALVRAAALSDDALLRSLAAPGLDASSLRARLLSDPEGIVRQAAADELGRRADRAALAALKRASFDGSLDPQGLARLSALNARLALGDASAADGLRSWMHNPDVTSRLVAVSWAGLHASLAGALRDRARRDEDEQVREAAWQGLARLGDEKAVARLAGRWDFRTYRTHAAIDPEGARARLRSIVDKPKDPPAAPGYRRDLWFVDAATAAVALIEAGDPSGRSTLHHLLDLSASGPPGRTGPAARGPGPQTQVLLSQLRLVALPADLQAAAAWIDTRDPAVRITAATVCLSASSKTGCRLEAD